MYSRIALSSFMFGLLGGVGWMLASKVIDFESRETPPPVVEELISEPDASAVQGLDRTEFEGADEGQRAWAESVSPSMAMVMIEVTTLKGVTGHPPRDCESWEVWVRYRRAHDGPTASKVVSLDRNGRVAINFKGMVVMDRITCIPPQASGFGFAVEQEDIEILRGQKHTALLHVTPAQSAFGKVVNHFGEAVTNASVHVFPRKQSRGLGDWDAGILTTSTDAEGHFRFDQLPNGAWVFAVQPTDWLMYSPGLEEQSEGHGLLFFYGEDDDASDVGVLGVVPMSVVQLKVIGSNDVPAADVFVSASPIQLDDPNVKASEEDDFRSLDDILLPYANYYFQTDANGEARLRLADGRWKLRIMNFPGIHTLDFESLAREFTSHEGNLSFQIPAPMTRFSGSYVSPDGRPIAKAHFSLTAHGLGWGSTMTHLDGSFTFPSVLVTDSFELSVRTESLAWLPDSWTLSSQSMLENFQAVATASASLRFTVRDLDGLPIQQPGLYLSIVGRYPEDALTEGSFASRWTQSRGIQRGVESAGVQEIRGLMPGKYELALFFRSDRVDSFTGSRPGAEEVRRWTIETGDAVHELRVAVPH